MATHKITSIGCDCPLFASDVDREGLTDYPFDWVVNGTAVRQLRFWQANLYPFNGNKIIEILAIPHLLCKRAYSYHLSKIESLEHHCGIYEIYKNSNY